MELLQELADSGKRVVGDLSDGGVLDDDLADVVGPKHVPEQPLHVAVGDGQVGDLNLGRSPQPNRHTCCKKIKVHSSSFIVKPGWDFFWKTNIVKSCNTHYTCLISNLNSMRFPLVEC